MRKAPKLTYSDRFYDCAYLTSGVDTLEESASVFIDEKTWQRLEDAKAYASERNKGANQAYTTKLGGMEFQIKPHGGSGGAIFILNNDMYTVTIRGGNIDYNLSVVYRSRVLWADGPDVARQRIWSVLLREMAPRQPEKDNPDSDLCDWRRVSRIDFAFDFHSPEFSEEISPNMIDRVICHSSSKWRWDFKLAESDDRSENKEIDGYAMGRGGRIQTLTVGRKDSLQIQVYKKSDEITEKSQKKWMYLLWEQAGLLRPDSGKHDDVWRIEVRFSREYLKQRNVDEYEDFLKQKEELLAEALKSRRLTDKTADTNRRRWPVHPMWSQAIDMAGDATEFIDLSNYKEEAPEAVMRKIKQDMKAAIRRAVALKTGGADYNWLHGHNLTQEILAEVEADDNHGAKMEEYSERYKYINRPL